MLKDEVAVAALIWGSERKPVNLTRLDMTPEYVSGAMSTKAPAASRIAPPKALLASIFTRNWLLSSLRLKETISRARASVLVSPGWSAIHSNTPAKRRAGISLQ